MTESPTTNSVPRIRRAVHQDAVAIAHVHCAAALAAYADMFPADAPKPAPATLAKRWTTTLTDGSTAVFVAESGDDIIGVVALASDPDVPSGVLFTKFYIEPQRWGGGIGSLLHDHAINWARRRGDLAVNLWVLEANHRARRMYERRGWSLVPGRTLVNEPTPVVEVLYNLDL